MFELHQLRCFVAVADHLHFGQAATQLNMTQPPLSRQIQLLEREVGVPLFDRTSRSVRLTPAGRVFLPEAKRILRLSESAMKWTRRVWRGEAGTLRIGFTAASGYGMLPALIRQLRAIMPDVDLVLREMVTRLQIEALDSGVLDLGFMRPSAELRRFAVRDHATEAMVVALPTGEAPAAPDAVPLADLHDRPFIMYSPDNALYFHDLVTALLAQHQVQPKIVEQVGQIHSMLALVDAGFGAALVPETASRLHFPAVVFRPLARGVSPPVRLNAAWHRENDNPALARFLAEAPPDQVKT